VRVYRLRLFGREVASWEVDGEDPAELLAAAIAELVDPDDTENNTEEHTQEHTQEHTIGGGSAHDFELDPDRRAPDDRYAPWEDRFGFSKRNEP